MGRKADECDIWNKTKRGRRSRNSTRDHSRADHCIGHPDLPVPAVQYSVRLNEGDAAGRRLPFCLEIQLRLQQVFVAVVTATVRGTPPERLVATTRRCGGLSAAQGSVDRLHQACD